jgi:tetratricopeptide (TPR) repeat protein
MYFMKLLNVKGQMFLLMMVTFFITVSLSGCASLSVQKYEEAQIAFASQDYDKAFDANVESLKSDIKNKEAIMLFPDVAPKTYALHITDSQREEDNQAWDKAASEYDRIENMNQSVTAIIELVKKEYYSGGKNDLKVYTDKIIAIPLVDVAKKKEAVKDKAASLHYKEGTQLVKEKKYRDAAGEFDKALSFVPNYKDAAGLKEKYTNIANTGDAEDHYIKGINYAKNMEYRNAVEEFSSSLTFVPNYKDAEPLSAKYKAMADEQDAKIHYDKAIDLMNKKDYSGAYEEFKESTKYVSDYKDTAEFMKKCEDNMPPSAEAVAVAVGRCLQSDIPISWVGNLMGGKNAKVMTVEVVKVGIYNQRQLYWPMKIHVVGTCQLNDPFNQGKVVKFDNVGNFMLSKDDYGEWQAQLTEGMFQ